MTLPEKSLFTVKEAQEHLALSKSSIYNLINEGLLEVRHPRPRSTRITRESIAAHLERSKSGEAVRLAMNENKAKKAVQQQETQEVKKQGLLERWGLRK